MLEVEISHLHVWFPSGRVNNNRNLAPFLIRCVTGMVCWIPDEPSLRWDKLWRSANGSDGQPPLRCPQVRWGDGGCHPKRGGDGAGGIQARSLALLNGWAGLFGGILARQIRGDVRDVLQVWLWHLHFEIWPGWFAGKKFSAEEAALVWRCILGKGRCVWICPYVRQSRAFCVGWIVHGKRQVGEQSPGALNVGWQVKSGWCEKKQGEDEAELSVLPLGTAEVPSSTC